MVSPNVVAISLFTDAGQANLPEACDLVCTGGFSRLGCGAGRYIRDAAVDASYLAAHPRTAFVDSSGRGFRLMAREVDVRQVGAIGDGYSDDTAAIQEALDIVEAAGGGTVMLSPGDYKTTAPITLPPRASIRGAGPASILQVTSCDALIISASDGIGPRLIADFMIRGQKCENFTAIVTNIIDEQRVQGVVFERIYIAFFGIGVRSRGLWHSTFRTITMNQVWVGFTFSGRNIKITIDDCRLTHGGSLKGLGDPVGIRVGDETPSARPEDIQIDKSIIYGFKKAIVWRTALFGGVTNCDLDACTLTGLELITADGGFTFVNNWIQVDGDSACGVMCVALGYNPNLTNIRIANNYISIPSLNAKSCGIKIGNQQSDLLVDNNTVSGPWQIGIHADGVRRLSLLNNKVEQDIFLERCVDLSVARNFALKGVKLRDNVRLETGSMASADRAERD